MEQRFSEVGLLFVEAKIKEVLLFDPSSWELFGFIDLEKRDAASTEIYSR